MIRDKNRTVSIASGLGNVDEQTPMRPGDRFRIASHTKTYVATVVLQLVSEGKLRLDDTVEQWLPGLVPNGDEITIRQLLNMTSGLFDYEQDPRVFAPYINGDLGYHWSPLELVQIAVSHEPLFEPGATQSYSNTGYILAGLIIEAATGNTLRGELSHRIFRPLDLRATSFPTSPGSRVGMRTATSSSGSLPESTSPASIRSSGRQARSSPRLRTTSASTGRFSPVACSKPACCGRGRRRCPWKAYRPAPDTASA